MCGVVCKYYTISYKWLKHPWILVSTGGPGTTPPRIPREDCVTHPTFIKKPLSTSTSSKSRSGIQTLGVQHLNSHSQALASVFCLIALTNLEAPKPGPIHPAKWITRWDLSPHLTNARRHKWSGRPLQLCWCLWLLLLWRSVTPSSRHTAWHRKTSSRKQQSESLFSAWRKHRGPSSPDQIFISQQKATLIFSKEEKELLNSYLRLSYGNDRGILLSLKVSGCSIWSLFSFNNWIAYVWPVFSLKTKSCLPVSTDAQNAPVLQFQLEKKVDGDKCSLNKDIFISS